MQTIKRLNEYKYECSGVVLNGEVLFELTNKIGLQVFKTVYKDSAELSTSNESFVYSFSDLEVSSDKTLMKAKVSRLLKGKNIPANNIKVYLCIKGERDNHKSEALLLILLSFITIGLVLFGKSPILLAFLTKNNG